MTDIASIARGLSGAQRKALLLLKGEFAPIPRDITRQSVAGLARYHSDLCQREWQDGCAQSTYYRLTPLGLRVRAFLRGEGK